MTADNAALASELDDATAIANGEPFIHECPDCGFRFELQSVHDDTDCPACFARRSLVLRCPECSQVKSADTPERAAYVLAFHMDRRHRGWTLP